MRIVRFDNWSTGLLLGEDRVLDVSATVQRPEAVALPAVQCVAPFFTPHSLDWAPMISAWPLVKPALEQLIADALGGDPRRDRAGHAQRFAAPAVALAYPPGFRDGGKSRRSRGARAERDPGHFDHRGTDPHRDAQGTAERLHGHTRNSYRSERRGHSTTRPPDARLRSRGPR